MFEVLGLAGVTSALLLKLLAGYLITKEGVDIFQTVREQNRVKGAGKANIDLLTKQLTAKTEGQKLAFDFNRESTLEFLQLLQQDKTKDRQERRQSRTDQLRLAQQQQQLSLIQSLIQGIGDRSQQERADRQTLREPPPLSVVNAMRGLL